jgi:hypothetical protein
MSNSQVANAARAAAKRFAGSHPELPIAIEQALTADPLKQRGDRVVDPISLGALIVSACALGWTIYHDIKKDRRSEKPDREQDGRSLVSRLRDKWPEIARLEDVTAPSECDQILIVIAEEVVSAAAGEKAKGK